MGNNLQKIILYLTINTENLKFYVGLHECDPDVYDYYLGDGCHPTSIGNERIFNKIFSFIKSFWSNLL